MQPTEIVERDLSFGPFETEVCRESVDANVRRAVLSFIREQVLPHLDGVFTHMEGRVTSHYDKPEYATRSDLRFRYYLKCTFHSPEGDETAQGELIYDPETRTCTACRVKPLRLRCLKWHPSPSLDSGPSPQRGICPRCNATVTGTLAGIAGVWQGYSKLTGEPCMGVMHEAVCLVCQLPLATFVKDSDETPSAETCVWVAR